MSRVRIASEVEEEVWVELLRHARDLGRPLPEVLTEALSDYLAQHRFRPDILGSLEATASAGHTMEELLREAPARERRPAPAPLPPPTARQAPAPQPLANAQTAKISHPAIAPPLEAPAGAAAAAVVAPEAKQPDELVSSGPAAERRRLDPLQIT